MSHLPPKSLDELEFLAPILHGVRASMGFVPNSMLTMAHVPQLPIGFSLLATAVFGGDLAPLVAALAARIPPPAAAPEKIDAKLVQLIAFATSLAAGCRYCQAHTSHGAHRLGVDERQLHEILRFEESDAFTAGERAALALAFAAGRVPNESSAAHFDDLREHFNEPQTAQLVAVIALFGFLNRWNDTMGTTLEAAPAEYARTQLTDVGWDIGKHGS
jgi:AhpD family alkylhydroperoxidase